MAEISLLEVVFPIGFSYLRENLRIERFKVDVQAEAVFYWISSLKKKTTTRDDGDSSDDDNLGDEVDRWAGRRNGMRMKKQSGWNATDACGLIWSCDMTRERGRRERKRESMGYG